MIAACRQSSSGCCVYLFIAVHTASSTQPAWRRSSTNLYWVIFGPCRYSPYWVHATSLNVSVPLHLHCPRVSPHSLTVTCPDPCNGFPVMPRSTGCSLLYLSSLFLWFWASPPLFPVPTPNLSSDLELLLPAGGPWDRLFPLFKALTPLPSQA